ncbi:MAG: type II toxin-antitoxin system PemK/MazF family toxin [Planctomycetaceae bacterium]|nr:type II toxin-antitoxin system PemK/MazF family toxin [Planctomycetaceae bacterium]
MVASRFDVFLITLDPTVGHEMKKTRPCVVISPDDMNQHLQTIIVAPLTSRGRDYPSRVPCRFQDRSGEVALDQIRTVDRQRLVKRLGRLGAATQNAVLQVLDRMFAP